MLYLSTKSSTAAVFFTSSIFLLVNFESVASIRTRRNPDSFCSAQGEGFHSHPKDCTKFVRCVEQGTSRNGAPILKRFDFDCAPGTVFDPSIIVCNFPDQGGTPKDCKAKSASEIEAGSKPDGNENAAQITRTTTSTESPIREVTTQGPTPAPPSTSESDSSTPLEPLSTTDAWTWTTPEALTTSEVQTTPETLSPTTTTWNPTPNACSSCNNSGGISNKCDIETGNCICKANVVGPECDTCSSGHFNLDPDNELGCLPCFCFGHSDTCESAQGFGIVYLESRFERGIELWRAENEYGERVSLQFSPFTQDIGVTSSGDSTAHFVAPGRFLGDQRQSYNRNLDFTLRISAKDPIQSSADIILEGSGPAQEPLKVAMSIFGPKNPLPSFKIQKYSVKLHPTLGWKPELTEFEFMKLLSNLTSIRIRGTYTVNGTGNLDNVSLESAKRGVKGPKANWVEHCNCPKEYSEQNCQHCTPGYTKATVLHGAYSECIPCNCSGHSRICDPELGNCVSCADNTTGEHCELCRNGFYIDTVNGPLNECKKCPCKEYEQTCSVEGGTMYCFAYLNVSSITPETTELFKETTLSEYLDGTITLQRQ